MRVAPEITGASSLLGYIMHMQATFAQPIMGHDWGRILSLSSLVICP